MWVGVGGQRLSDSEANPSKLHQLHWIITRICQFRQFPPAATDCFPNGLRDVRSTECDNHLPLKTKKYQNNFHLFLLKMGPLRNTNRKVEEEYFLLIFHRLRYGVKWKLKLVFVSEQVPPDSACWYPAGKKCQTWEQWGSGSLSHSGIENHYFILSSWYSSCNLKIFTNPRNI